MTQDNTAMSTPNKDRYAQALEASRRMRWDIDQHVLRGRSLDRKSKYLPDGLSLAGELDFLLPAEVLFYSQIQGRTYANTFGLVERYIGAKTAELSRDHALGNQVAFEALIRLTDEELKHQELFRRLDRMAAEVMPEGYRFMPQPDEVASVVLSKCDWAVMALTLDIEIFTQVHYRSSIEPDEQLSELWKDVFLFHWREESQHALLDELEWRRIDALLSPAERERGVSDFIELVGAVDKLMQVQAASDATYFLANTGRRFTADEAAAVRDAFGRAYRWQYVVSGAQVERFGKVLAELVTPAQMTRIGSVLAPLVASCQAKVH